MTTRGTLVPCSLLLCLAGITATGAVAAPLPAPATAQVDPFGQAVQAQFPEKVTSERELTQDAQDEKAYYAGLHPPTFDRYGGLPGTRGAAGGGLKATGFFHVERHNGRWLLVDPLGNLFYALGVCAMGVGDDYTEVKGRESTYQWLPPANGEFKTAYLPDHGADDFSFYIANVIRKYGKPYSEDEFTSRMINRVRKWGFNTGGPFSSPSEATRRANLPYARILPLGEYDGLPPLPGAGGAFDPFDEANRRTVDRNLAAELRRTANDPLILGYFFTNEPLYENIPRAVPKLTGKYACKQRLVEFLREKYTTIYRFNASWNTKAASFGQLGDMALSPDTPTAAQDVKAFTNLFLETYYRLVAGTARKYDKHHMLMGNRFQSGTINNEDLCRIAGKYLDIMSFNYYTYGPDKDFLNRIYRWTGRPMILSEYYYDSPAESGLSGGSLDMKTQADRGRAYRHYVEQTASLGYVVGAEWFLLIDQSVTGRWFQHYDGERANAGLISVTDRPWKDMLAQAMRTNYEIYDVVRQKRPPYRLDDPRFTQEGGATRTLGISRAAGPIAMDGTAAGFPGVPAEQITGKRLVVGPDAGGVEASFKACWDDDYLYVLFDVTDPTPMMNAYTGDEIWNGDAVELFLGAEKPDQDGALLPTDRQILLSASKADGQGQWHFMQGVQPDGVKLVVVPNTDGKGYALEAALPFKGLGFIPKPDAEIRFDVCLDDGAGDRRRVRQFIWNGGERDSSDRTSWGRAKLIR